MWAIALTFSRRVASVMEPRRRKPLTASAKQLKTRLQRLNPKACRCPRRKPGPCAKSKSLPDGVVPACKALLDELPMQELDIEKVPIEYVIRRIFAR